MTRASTNPAHREPAHRESALSDSALPDSVLSDSERRGSAWTVLRRPLSGPVDLEVLFPLLFTKPGRRVWLDSSGPGAGSGRYSVMGEASDDAGARFTYRLGDPGVRVERFTTGQVDVIAGGVLEVLADELARIATPAQDLPFTGGLVGWFGYELKADLGFPPLTGSQTRNEVAQTGARRVAPPDADWLLIDRFVVLDHELERAELVALVPVGPLDPTDPSNTDPNNPDPSNPAHSAALAWFERAGLVCRRPVPVARSVSSGAPRRAPGPADMQLAQAAMGRSREDYLVGVRAAIAALEAGESYEICVTDTARLPFDGSPFELYRALRAANPAPYAAYLELGDVCVLSASPERFLHVDAGGRVETRPIKGTAAREADPRRDAAAAHALRTDAKTRAENLIVVDLLRNDLHRACVPGSVATPRLLEVETYPSVHQLVSTVQGQLLPGLGPLDAVRTCFPGGSMTGAPKRRTCELIEEIEGAPRGIYSGALGYLSSSGAADLAIVIRTAVVHDGEVSVGAGGGIVLDSDPEAEYAEMLLKACATLRVIAGHQVIAGHHAAHQEEAAAGAGPGQVSGVATAE